MEPIQPSQSAYPVNAEINFFGMTNYRNQNRKFGIKLDDRRRHVYVVGKTGMGKTTVLENMVLNDIYAGHGVGVVDPHGDFAEKIIDYIPAHRINDVVYFNPSDIDYPIGFNILETIRPEQKHLVVSGLMAVFKKIWPDVWSARMEYILNNTILALIDFPGTTLLGINRMLADAEYRRRVVNNSKDPVVKAFWQTEFANYAEKFRTEAVAPIQNKIGQFLSASVIRNIVAQVKSRINVREIMDTKKIFVMNLSKGRIGEDNSRLLGGMLINRIQLAAMERVDVPEPERNDFFLYVDEFQNFATESFANILSEARKYRLDLIMAHQYMEQLEEEVLAAVIGNIGTMMTFRVGSTDAEILAKELAPTFVEEDLVNLPKFHIYLKLMIDGVASRPFSALTLPPIGLPTGSTDRVIRVSRERYAVPREKIEDKIMRWSGMMVTGEDEAGNLEIDDDEAMFRDPIAPAKAPLVPQPNLVKPAPSAAPRPVLPPTPSQPPAVKIQPIIPPRLVNRDNQRVNEPNSLRLGGQWEGGQSPNAGKRKRKRKKNGNLSPATGERVLLVNPEEKGISLQQLRPSVSQPPPASLDRPSVSQPRREELVRPQPAVSPRQNPAPDRGVPAAPAPLDIGLVPPPRPEREKPDQANPNPPPSLGFVADNKFNTNGSPPKTTPPAPASPHPRPIQPGAVVKISG